MTLPASAAFHRLDFGVPARVALKCALLVVRLVRLNKRKPKRLTTLRARPKSEVLVCRFLHMLDVRDSFFEGNDCPLLRQRRTAKPSGNRLPLSSPAGRWGNGWGDPKVYPHWPRARSSVVRTAAAGAPF